MLSLILGNIYNLSYIYIKKHDSLVGMARLLLVNGNLENNLTYLTSLHKHIYKKKHITWKGKGTRGKENVTYFGDKIQRAMMEKVKFLSSKVERNH